MCEPECGETPQTCPNDCSSCICGDYYCDPWCGEDTWSCPTD
jgi:hypothetical protein